MAGSAPIQLFLEADLRGQESCTLRDGVVFKIEDELVNAPGAALVAMTESDRALIVTLREQARTAGREVSTSMPLISRGCYQLTGRQVLVNGHSGMFQRLVRYQECGLISGLKRIG